MDLTTFIELFAWPLAAVMLAATAAPLMGVFLHARGAGFHGIMLPQLATFGVALGFALYPLFGHGQGHFHEPEPAYLFLWAAIAVAVGLIYLAIAKRGVSEAGRESSRVAAVFVVASGGTVVASQLSPHGGLHVEALLSGEALASGAGDVGLLGLVTLGILGVVLCGWRDLTASGQDPLFQRALGRSPRRWDLMLSALAGVLVTVGSLTVGPLPLFALLVLPVLTVARHARSMASFLVVAPLVGVMGAGVGAGLAFWIDLPIGVGVVVGCVAVAAASSTFRIKGAKAS